MDVPLDKEILDFILWQYANKVVVLTKQIDKSKVVEIKYEKIGLSDFKYDHDRIRYSYDFNSIENSIRYEWRSSSDNGEFLNNSLFKSQEALEFKKYLLNVKADLIEEFIIPYSLSGFSHIISKLALNNNDTKESIQRLISILSDEIELILANKSDKLMWEITVEIANLHLENSFGSKDNSYYLVQKTEIDFTIERPVQHISERERIFSIESNVTSKIQFSSSAKKEKITGFYPETIKSQIQTELNILRLFKVGSFYPVSEHVKPISLIEYEIELNKEYPYESLSSEKVAYEDKGNFPYMMKASDLDNFEIFRERLFELVQKIDPENYLCGNYIDIAFHRYLDALLRSEVYSYRIISAISCLEALLSKKEPEVTYKLKLRLSILLSCVGFNPKDVSNKISEAYSLRSKIVHGSELKQKELVFARESCGLILDFARITTLISIQLKKEFEKDAFLKFLDNALLDKTDFALLEERLKMLTIT